MHHSRGYVSTGSSALLSGVEATLNRVVLAETHSTVVAGLICPFADLSPAPVRAGLVFVFGTLEESLIIAKVLAGLTTLLSITVLQGKTEKD